MPSSWCRKDSANKKLATLGKGITQFGDCRPYCDKRKIKALIPEFIEVYRNKPFSKNQCGCQVNHCFINFVVGRLSDAPHIVENGVNAGMSGYLFRSAQPDAEVWHIDPLSKPICDPDSRKRWKDTGKGHYLVGPSSSIYYSKMASTFAKTDGKDARGVAMEYNSTGFQDFFEVDWSATSINRKSALIFFDTHQPDFDNVLKARGLGFTTFLVDDNYHTTVGDMAGNSLKQVFSRGSGQAKNLADVLDFYYEMPPLVNPFEMDAAQVSKILAESNRFKSSHVPKGFVFNKEAHDMGLYQDALLDLNNPKDSALFKKLLEVVDIEEFAWYNHMAVLGVQNA